MNSQTMMAPVTGWYSVVVTDSNGCSATSAQVYYNMVGGAEPESSDIYGLGLYPNPSNGILHLRALEPIMGPVEIEVWDMLGQQLRSYQFPHLLDAIEFDFQELAKGPYFMRIRNMRKPGDAPTTLKFVIQ